MALSAAKDQSINSQPFTSDIQKLRADARANIEKGPVTKKL